MQHDCPYQSPTNLHALHNHVKHGRRKVPNVQSESVFGCYQGRRSRDEDTDSGYDSEPVVGEEVLGDVGSRQDPERDHNSKEHDEDEVDLPYRRSQGRLVGKVIPGQLPGAGHQCRVEGASFHVRRWRAVEKTRLVNCPSGWRFQWATSVGMAERAGTPLACLSTVEFSSTRQVTARTLGEIKVFVHAFRRLITHNAIFEKPIIKIHSRPWSSSVWVMEPKVDRPLVGFHCENCKGVLHILNAT